MSSRISRQPSSTLGLPRDEFRMWLALHETTHAFEFEAHPWLRDHFNDMLERYFGFLREDAVNLRSQGLSGLRSTSIGSAPGAANPGAGWNR